MGGYCFGAAFRTIILFSCLNRGVVMLGNGKPPGR